MFTESVRHAVGDLAPTRPLDRIAVRGSAKGVSVWTARRALSEVERKAWALHEHGFQLYLARDFGRAVSFFSEVQTLLPDDGPSRMLIERCRGSPKIPRPPAGTAWFPRSSGPRARPDGHVPFLLTSPRDPADTR